jgi:cobalt-zinc-cadmium efflux system membrane fusion protein
MTTRTLAHLSLLPSVIVVAALATACGPRPVADGATAAGTEHAHEEAGAGHAHEESGGEASGGAEPSDLDLPLSAIFSKDTRCEHAIPTYTCDQCRYEVGVVRLPQEVLAASDGSVAVAVVERRPWSGAREAPGEIALDADRAAWLGPRAPGVVRSIRVDLGDRVRAGETLYEVESVELGDARSEYRRALAEQRVARAAAEREADLFARGICPESDLLEARARREQADASAEAARSRLGRLGLTGGEIATAAAEPGGGAAGRGAGGDDGLLPVRAPFAGTVLERDLGLGARVEPGDRALLLADTSVVWVETAIAERELEAVLEHQRRGAVPAIVTVSAFPARSFPGRLDRLGGTVDEATRTIRARVVVDNADGALRAGMFARVRLQLDGEGDALVVPAEAVLEDEGRPFLFVRATTPGDAEYFVRRAVRPGRSAEGWVEILGGLEAGQAIVTKGAFLLKSDVLRAKMGAGCAD